MQLILDSVWDMADLSSLTTEQVNAEAKGIHNKDATALLDILMKYQLRSVDAVASQLAPISDIARLGADTLKKSQDGRIIVVGAGTSIRLCVQNLIELQTHGWPASRTDYIVAGGLDALTKSIEAGEDDRAYPVAEVGRLGITEKDILIGVSASGRTPVVEEALREARKRGALTIAIANNKGAPIAELAETHIFLETPPEPIGGSTRMGAGTSQKICLDLLTNGMLFHHGGFLKKESLEQLDRCAADCQSNGFASLPDFLQCLLESERQAVASVCAARDALVPAIEKMAEQLGSRQGRLLTGGAGTTARALVQELAELYPTFGFPTSRSHSGILGGHDALLRDYMEVSDQNEYAWSLFEHFQATENDIAILGSVSGKTTFTNVLATLFAREDIPTIGFTNDEAGELLSLVDYPVYLKSSKEPGGKLTRLGAGTAHKVVLNVSTSAAMTVMGHVYDGYMVDVKLFCEKLVERAERIVKEITGCSEEVVRKALAQTKTLYGDASVSKAILHLNGVAFEEMDAFLKAHENKSSRAIEASFTLKS